jgi:molybdopterin-guanine dinucleotide biosynthesis protein A
MKRILGAVLAGGAARRFGSDKALAPAFGKPLIAHAIGALEQVASQVVVCGRAYAGRTCLADRPEPGQGPLGGLNAALHHARARGFEWVLSIPCDTPSLARDLLQALVAGGRSQVAATCPVIGLWPSGAADQLDAWLTVPGNRSMRGWAEAIGAAPVHRDATIANINTAQDLAAWVSSVSAEPI